MSTNLPVPAPRRELGTPVPDLAALPGAPSRTGHRRSRRLEQVTCLDWAAGLLAAGGGRVCCVWDTRSHALRLRLVFDEPVGAVWMSRDRASIAVASGSTVSVHDLATGAPRFSYGHDGGVTGLHVGDPATLLASADTTGRIQVRELSGGRVVQDLRHPPGSPLVFVHRGRYLLVESQTHCTLVDVGTGDAVRRFPYDPREAVATDGPALNTTLVSHSGSMLRWFDCDRHEHAYCSRDLGSTIRSIDIQGTLVLAATANGHVHLYELGSGAPRARYESFTHPLMFARFGENASILAASGEALVMQWIEGRHVRSYYDESPPLVAMAVPPGRQTLLASDRDGGIARFDLRDGRRQPLFAGHAGSVSVVAASDEWIAAGAYDGTVRLWRWDGSPAAAINLAQGPVQALAFDPIADRIWAGTWSGKLSCLDIATGAELRTIEAVSASVRTLAIDAKRHLLCAGGDTGELKVFDLHGNGDTVFDLQQPGTAYRALFDHAGDLLAAADDGVRRYSGWPPEPHSTYPGDTIRWFDIRGGRLCSLSLSGELRLFDVASGELLQHVRIDAPVNHRSVAWFNDDRLLTASADGLVRVFDGQLRLVATLEVLRHGLLWCTPGRGGQTGWIFSDRTDLVDVGDVVGGVLTPWDVSDTRRARHLAVWNSASHVMKAVDGGASPAATSTFSLGVTAGLVGIGHRLGHG